MLPLHPSPSKKVSIRWLSLLEVLFLLLIALCYPAAATNDVRVALTDLKPSLYTDDQGKPMGFFVDIIEDMAAKEDWNIIWVRGSLSESWERLASGDIDLLPAVTVTPDRQNFYDFTEESVISIWSQVYTRPGSGINTILDLNGKRIAMVRGASSGIGFRDYAQKFGINTTNIEKNTPDEVFFAVKTGDADALVVYNSAGQEDSITYGLVDTPVMFNPAQFVFAVQKGENQNLIGPIDSYIAEGKNNPSSTYHRVMQKWYGIKADEIIPSWLWWGLLCVAFLAALFLCMSYFLKREVRRKTSELAEQNEELQHEVANRTRAETELVQKNDELRAAYEQLAAMEKELRENYQDLIKSDQALMQARKKLQMLNTLAFQDIQNAIFSLSGFIQISQDVDSIEETQTYLHTMEKIVQSLEETLLFAHKYQSLGINQPQWLRVIYVLINAISHLDFREIKRTVEMPEIEIYADPLLEDVFLALMETIIQSGASTFRISHRFRKNADGIVILIESDGSGIPVKEKEKVFSREQTGKAGTSLFLAREILSITGITLEETGEEGKGICFEMSVPGDGYRILNKQE